MVDKVIDGTSGGVSDYLMCVPHGGAEATARSSFETRRMVHLVFSEAPRDGLEDPINVSTLAIY